MGLNGDELVDQLDDASRRVHGTAPVLIQMPSGQFVEIDRVTVVHGRAVLVMARGAAPARGDHDNR